MRARFFFAAFSAAALLIPSAEAQEHESSSSATQQSSQTEVQHARVSKLLGSNVHTKDGTGLGQIEDLVVNPATGQIQFALLGKGEFSGVGDRLIPVPWQAVNVSAEKQYTVNVDRQKLSSLPTLDEQRYSDLSSPDYIIGIYRFYQIDPGEGVGSSGAETGAESGTEIRPDDTERQKLHE